ALHLFIQSSGFAQPARNGECQQFFVGTRIPQEEGKTGSQFEIRESNLGIGRRASSRKRASTNRTIEEVRAGQYRSQDLLDSEVEASTITSSCFIEPHEAIPIVGGNRPAERPTSQVFR